jgi:regulator of sirC expression with transglutaminase-like and TPR domain
VEDTLRFVELVNGPSRHLDLASAALLLSRHANPDLDIDHQLERLAELAAGCTEPTLDGVRRLLFDELGFTGDSDNYYSPANSLLDRVLDRRKGLPITLSLLTIHIGRSVGVPLDGVGMPGHFLVRDRVLTDVFLDPFRQGRLLSGADCERIFVGMAGPGVVFDPAYLNPISDPMLLCRMAANLVNAYRRSDNRSGLRWSARLRSRCPGVEPAELAQLGQAMGHTGAFDEGAALLDAAGEGLIGEPAVRAVRSEAAHLRARLN